MPPTITWTNGAGLSVSSHPGNIASQLVRVYSTTVVMWENSVIVQQVAPGGRAA